MKELEKIIQDYNVYVRLIQSDEFLGFVCKRKDGYLVLIDNRLSEYQTRKVLTHELTHIVLGHLDEHADKSEIEKEDEVHFALKAMGY